MISDMISLARIDGSKSPVFREIEVELEISRTVKWFMIL